MDQIIATGEDFVRHVKSVRDPAVLVGFGMAEWQLMHPAGGIRVAGERDIPTAILQSLGKKIDDTLDSSIINGRHRDVGISDKKNAAIRDHVTRLVSTG